MLIVYLEKNGGVFEMERSKSKLNLKMFQDYSYRRWEDLK